MSFFAVIQGTTGCGTWLFEAQCTHTQPDKGYAPKIYHVRKQRRKELSQRSHKVRVEKSVDCDLHMFAKEIFFDLKLKSNTLAKRPQSQQVRW